MDRASSGPEIGHSKLTESHPLDHSKMPCSSEGCSEKGEAFFDLQLALLVALQSQSPPLNPSYRQEEQIRDVQVPS